MKARHGWISQAVIWALAAALVGCGNREPQPSEARSVKEVPEAHASVPKPNAPTPDAVTPPVTNRPANPNGRVFVVEYHHVRTGKGDMFRTPEEFRSDLERLYNLGFRPCTVSDYLDDKFPIPPGASPAVFTFDDSNPSQLQLQPDGSVDPTCAVGIWMEFAKTHPDFPVRGTFYVLPDVMFGQPKLRDQKVALLKSLGCELGSHTVSHPRLRNLSDEKVKQELAGAIDYLNKLGVNGPVSIALPFGISPKNKSLLKGFDYNGKSYAMRAAFLVGAEPAPAPTDPKLNRYRIPRIQVYGGDYGLDDWLNKLQKGQVKPLVVGTQP